MTVNEDLVGAFDDCQTLARVQSLCCYYQLYTYDLHVAVINACSERNHWEKKNFSLVELLLCRRVGESSGGFTLTPADAHLAGFQPVNGS